MTDPMTDWQVLHMVCWLFVLGFVCPCAAVLVSRTNWHWSDKVIGITLPVCIAPLMAAFFWTL